MKVLTRYNRNRILQSVEDDVLGKICEQILNLQEEGIRQALINMGWTPPPEDKPNG